MLVATYNAKKRKQEGGADFCTCTSRKKYNFTFNIDFMNKITRLFLSFLCNYSFCILLVIFLLKLFLHRSSTCKAFLVGL